MTIRRSSRRVAAVITSVGVIAGALVLAPAIAGPALASDGSTGTSLITALNDYRQKPIVDADALSPNGYANVTAHNLAIIYSGSGHPCAVNASGAPAPSTPDAPSAQQPVCTEVSAG